MGSPSSGYVNNATHDVKKETHDVYLKQFITINVKIDVKYI